MELLSCPFCGSPAEMQRYNGSSRSKTWFHFVTCTSDEDCPGIIREDDEQGGVAHSTLTEQEAADLWNTRFAGVLCNRPPAGWYCGLARDHKGPCPAWPVSHETAAMFASCKQCGEPWVNYASDPNAHGCQVVVTDEMVKQAKTAAMAAAHDAGVAMGDKRWDAWPTTDMWKAALTAVLTIRSKS